jgi:hypothetical protein
MTPQSPVRTRILLLMSTILASPILAAECNACQTYAQDLSYVSYNFDTNAASGGPIKQIDIGAMCLTGAGLNNMITCYECDYLTGHDLQILEAWILVCNTLKVSGQTAALACWNTDKNQCVTVSGVDAPSALSLSPSATAPVTTLLASDVPGTTAGGDGGSDTETVTSTEAEASTTSTETTTSSTTSTSQTSGTTRSGSGAPASTTASSTASSTSTPKSNSGDRLTQNGLSNANLVLWLAVVGFLL